ncbi:TonB-dependent receptor domain-containing protein [Pacificimonas pallii]|uniref:TonB-dependent receptor domain-containing protein n=1 Tax=Pacificimonas pallii TaxID=2827236 RepID=UPI0034E2595E
MPDQAGAEDDTDLIVVTGSFIRGTPEDAALPVDLFSSEDLSKSGTTSPLEFIKDLPSVGPVLGDSNQFSTAAQGFQGNGSINLRALGPERTLVLFNGRRTVQAPGDGFTDTQLVPLFALDRIEILKDGAAATYGSDAIAGVANFITKRDFDGLEITGDYEFIDGSDGNWTTSVLAGGNFGDANLMVGVGWQHRSELATTERDFVLRPYEVNPTGFSTLGNPGTYLAKLGDVSNGAGGTTLGLAQDGSALGTCEATGGFQGSASGLPACRFTYVPFDNLIEEEDRYQAYAQLDVDLSDSLNVFVSGLYARTDLESLAYSPSFPTTQGPTGSGNTQRFFIPDTNPGYAAFVAQSGLTGGPGDPFTAGTPANVFGSYASALFFRPIGAGGNPRDPRGSGRGSAKNEAFRFSTGLEKEFSDTLRAQLYGTWWRSEREAFAPGIVGSRLQNALEGFGGPGCDRTTGTAGQGACQFFNPFINNAASNPALGLVNPSFVPGNENDPDLVSYLQVPNGTFQVEEQVVADFILSGETGLDLGGGAVAFAVGAQYRQSDFSTRPLVEESNALVNPCFQEGDRSCVGTPTDGVGPFVFLGITSPVTLEQSVYALFAEVNVPIGERIELSGAVRFEDYGGTVGSTLNPKASFRIEATDWLTLRGSAGTTFRGPLASQVSPNKVTVLAGIIAANNNFKSQDIFGNPNDLQPETAFTYNVGAIIGYEGLTFSVDYWSYDFEDRITTTPVQAIASAVVPEPGGLANCSSPFANLITFQDGCVQGVTTGSSIARVRTDWVNGPGVKTSGLDFALNYDLPIGDQLVLSLGGNASFVLEYEFDAFELRGATVAEAYDAVGFANYNRDPGTVSDWRGNAYANVNYDMLNLRYVFKYIDGVDDNRCADTGPCVTTPEGIETDFGRRVSSFTQHDLHATLDLEVAGTDLQLQGSIENIFDEDPPGARLELSYDPFIGNPLGRTYRLGAKVNF